MTDENVQSVSDTEREIRTDKENDRVLIGDDLALSLRGGDGVKASIDHASAADGYVAFGETEFAICFEKVRDDE